MNPYEPGVDLDRRDPSLDEVASRLETYAAATGGEPPVDLATRITTAIDDEPRPAGRWAWLGTWSAPMRAVAAVAMLVVIVVGTLARGDPHRQRTTERRDLAASARAQPVRVAKPDPLAHANPVPVAESFRRAVADELDHAAAHGYTGPVAQRRR